MNTTHAEPRVTYVGDGRYACSGSSSECASVEQRNRQLEAQQQSRRLQQESLEEQRRQTRLMQEEQRSNDEYRRKR